MTSAPRRPLKSVLTYDRDDSTRRLSIFCNAESHVGRPWLIDSFYWGDVGGQVSPRWLRAGHYYRGGLPIADLPKSSRTVLVGNRVLSEDELLEDRADSGSRGRYDFKCHLCALSMSRREEVVHAAFSKLANENVAEVTLSLLAAILK